MAFVEESGGSVSSPSVILGATNVSVVSDSAITAVSPAIVAGTTYYVTVRTPTGTSSYGPVFTYSTLVPVVSSISVTAGTSAGGTSLTITGTGFYVGATVNFVEESAGSPVSPTVSVAATGVVLNGATTITAVSPAVTVGSTYFRHRYHNGWYEQRRTHFHLFVARNCRRPSCSARSADRIYDQLRELVDFAVHDSDCRVEQGFHGLSSWGNVEIA